MELEIFLSILGVVITLSYIFKYYLNKSINKVINKKHPGVFYEDDYVKDLRRKNKEQAEKRIKDSYEFQRKQKESAAEFQRKQREAAEEWHRKNQERIRQERQAERLKRQKEAESNRWANENAQHDDADFLIKNTSEILIELIKLGYNFKSVPPHILINVIHQVKKRHTNRYKSNWDYQYKQTKNNQPNKLNDENDYFKILELKPTTDFTLIKTAYRKQMKAYHPDKFTTSTDNEKKNSEAKSKKINEAYSFLKKKYE